MDDDITSVPVVTHLLLPLLCVSGRKPTLKWHRATYCIMEIINYNFIIAIIKIIEMFRSQPDDY